ncbi:hypothetical protein GRX66_07065, partial [Halobacterium sp. PCN9]|nr:hypothetical protein [Halobacterium bonnevillei]
LREEVAAFEVDADGDALDADAPDADEQASQRPTRADGFEWPNAD